MNVTNSKTKKTIYGPRRMTFWMTRDRTVDGLSGSVDVWLIRPDRVVTPFGAYWKLPPGSEEVLQLDTGIVNTHLGNWTIDMCLREAHVYPDADNQLIRVGPEPVIPKEIVS